MATHALSYLSVNGYKINHAVNEITRSLNEAGLKSPHGGTYGAWHINNWLYGRSQDANIEMHVMEYKLKGTDKLKAVQDLMNAARQLMAA